MIQIKLCDKMQYALNNGLVFGLKLASVKFDTRTCIIHISMVRIEYKTSVEAIILIDKRSKKYCKK